MNTIGFDYHWQFPAKTEKAAFKSVLTEPNSFLPDCTYFGFPWATLIDAFQAKSMNRWELVAALRQLRQKVPKQKRIITTCQHIYAAQYMELFAGTGITDIFWPHKTTTDSELEGITTHPFPLFPVQECPHNQLHNMNRKFLASFIGAYNPKAYLTEIRQAIFDLHDKEEDFLIIKRDTWHYDRAVYNEQLQGVNASLSQEAEEEKREYEYRDSLNNSWFCLCPSGSGPNSIRIFEALSYGSIPVILAKDLDLSYFPKELQETVLIFPDTREGLQTAIRTIREIQGAGGHIDRSAICQKHYPQLAPQSYSRIIESYLSTAKSP